MPKRDYETFLVVWDDGSSDPEIVSHDELRVRGVEAMERMARVIIQHHENDRATKPRKLVSVEIM